MTLTGTLGTVIWTAPEVLRNEPWVAASDVYSFSIVLAEMLTRKLPYDGIHLFAVPLKVTEGYRPPLSTHDEEAEAGGTVKPASPRIMLSAIEKQLACAAPISSSGLLPGSPSKRFLKP